jgi:hypothetical protein
VTTDEWVAAICVAIGIALLFFLAGPTGFELLRPVM